jgi:hypothetical protein
MLVLEDGTSLRLLAGIGGPELSAGEPVEIQDSPTRFGRVSLSIEAAKGSGDLHVKFKRAAGLAPSRVVLPARIGRDLQFKAVQGAATRVEDDRILVDGDARAWEADFVRAR